METFIAIGLVLVLAVSSLNYLTMAYTFYWMKTKLTTGFLVSQDVLDSTAVESGEDDEEGERRRAYL